MNKVKRQINEVQNTISELDFSVTCKASAEGFGVPVKLVVSGLDADKTNSKIIRQVKEAAAVGVMGKVAPEDVSDSVLQMECPIECKAWVISVLWFSFSSGNGDGHQKAWMKVYRRWDKNYSNDYKDKAMRDEMLMTLGLPKSWINKRAATPEQLNAAKVKVGLIGEAA